MALGLGLNASPRDCDICRLLLAYTALPPAPQIRKVRLGWMPVHQWSLRGLEVGTGLRRPVHQPANGPRRCLGPRALPKGTMWLSKVIWTSSFWHLDCRIGPLIHREKESRHILEERQRDHKRGKVHTVRETKGRARPLHCPDPWSAFWFQFSICNKFSFLDGLDISLLLETKRSLPLSTL